MALKKRIVAGILVRDGWAVQSIGFRTYLPVGDPAILAETLDRWQVDEILVQDISAAGAGRLIDTALVERIADRISTPLTVAGGIRSVSDVRELVAGGADRVAINTANFNAPRLMTETADVFGRQCMIGSIDVAPMANGGYRLHNRHVTDAAWAHVDPVDWACRLAAAGAGEILVNSVERDGTKRGYDFDMIDLFAAKLTVPLAVFGGAGKFAHILEAATHAGVAAIGAANLWSFSEHSVAQAKSRLARIGASVRHESELDYRARAVPGGWRPTAPDGAELDTMTERPLT